MGDELWDSLPTHVNSSDENLSECSKNRTPDACPLWAALPFHENSSGDAMSDVDPTSARLTLDSNANEDEASESSDHNDTRTSSSGSDWLPETTEQAAALQRDTLGTLRSTVKAARKARAIADHHRGDELEVPQVGVKRTRGQNCRTKGIDYELRANAVAYYDSLINKYAQGVAGSQKKRLQDAAAKFHINTKSGGTLKKWISASGRAKIEACLDGHKISEYAPGCKPINKGGRGKRAPGRGVKHLILRGRQGAKYKESEEHLIRWCRAQRKRGAKLTTRLVRAQMFFFTRNLYPLSARINFKASAGWMKRFMGRYGLTWRRRNDNARKSTESLLPGLVGFLNDLRLYRVKHPRPALDEEKENEDEVYGLFGPENTLNVDQVPLPFSSTDPVTLEFIGVKRVWIKQPGAGLDKRQCTLQLCIRALGEQPKPVLIFRGMARHKRQCDRDKRAAEEAQYDTDCYVLWQKKAWADTDTCIAWAATMLKDFVNAQLGEGAQCLLLADSLRAQVKQTFQDAVKTHANADTMFGVKGGSHIWQPVTGGSPHRPRVPPAHGGVLRRVDGVSGVQRLRRE